LLKTWTSECRLLKFATLFFDLHRYDISVIGISLSNQNTFVQLLIFGLFWNFLFFGGVLAKLHFVLVSHCVRSSEVKQLSHVTLQPHWKIWPNFVITSVDSRHAHIWTQRVIFSCKKTCQNYLFLTSTASQNFKPSCTGLLAIYWIICNNVPYMATTSHLLWCCTCWGQKILLEVFYKIIPKLWIKSKYIMPKISMPFSLRIKAEISTSSKNLMLLRIVCENIAHPHKLFSRKLHPITPRATTKPRILLSSKWHARFGHQFVLHPPQQYIFIHIAK